MVVKLYSDDIVLDMIDNLRIGLGHRYIPHPRDFVFTVNDREFKYYCRKLPMKLNRLYNGDIINEIRLKFRIDI